ncbi:MAG: CHRD domain-containing protein [Betaproteobacteria bacterium]
MNTGLSKPGIALAAVTLMFGVLVGGTALAIEPMETSLTGAQEVPPVKSLATGISTIVVNDDKTVSGSIKTTGIKGTAAHIHEGATGINGPHIVVLTMSSPDEWVIPPGSKLTDAQYQSLKDGNLYINVHSASHKDGEIRAQLKQ